MKVIFRTAGLLTLLTVFAGCGTSETTVIQPTETYEPTEQERANAEKEKEMAAERQQ